MKILQDEIQIKIEAFWEEYEKEDIRCDSPSFIFKGVSIFS